MKSRLSLVLLSILLSGCATGSQRPADLSRAVATAGTPTAESFRECSDCPQMVVVPSGRAIIGSPSNESGRDRSRSVQEGPRREVAIRAFAVGRFPMTLREWSAFVAATSRPVEGDCSWSTLPGSKHDGSNAEATWKHLGFEQQDDHPAVCISWFDAQDYVQWLSRVTGHRYRLLTEAEWEYAARAGTTTVFPWGAEARRDRANYGNDRCCSGLAVAQDRWTYTSPVGSFPPNAFGLSDMAGNAMQWVEDCVSDSYADLPSDGSAYRRAVPLKLAAFPQLDGQSSCAFHIFRGGNWGDTPEMIRSAARNFGPPPGSTLQKYRSAGGGLRVARSLDR